MPSPRQRRGTEAEDRAADFLLGKGFILIDRQVHSRYGEIDLLMQDGDVLVAVEVKYRSSDAYGRAIESVTEEKIDRILQTVYIVCEDRGLRPKEIRVDLVTIEPEGIEHYSGIGSV